MEKEFLDYPEALELKELGFDEPCFTYFLNGIMQPSLNPKDYTYFSEMSEINKNMLNYENVLTPTFSAAFRWFREKHNLVFNFISYSIVKPGEYHWSITWNDEAKAGGIVKTYEEAELACLKKLIEIVKQK